MDTVIEIRELCKTFGGKRAVDRLNLAVPKGAICALLGDNGAGKTTTIRMLTGLLPPDAGSARILGEDCWSAAATLRRRVAYVPERPRYYDWMTVAEIGWFAAGFNGKEYLPRFEEWAAKFLLDPKARLGNLSKGQYSKAGLALALALDPEVLILDEPTSGLDLQVRHEFLGSMVGMAAEGRTVLISSHQIAEIERIASHAAFIANGRLLLFAPLDDLKRQIVRVKLRWETTSPDPATLGTVLQRNGSERQLHAVIQDPKAEALEALSRTADVHDFEVSPLHLEEIYLALLGRKEGQP